MMANNFIYLLDCRPLKRMSFSENSFKGVGVVAFFAVVAFFVGAAGFVVGLAASFNRTVDIFTLDETVNWFLVASLEDNFFSFFPASVWVGAGHCSKQLKTNRGKARWAEIHNIELRYKKTRKKSVK